MPRILMPLLGAFVALSTSASVRLTADDTSNAKPAAASSSIEWLSDYGEAVKLAKSEERMLLVYFCTPGGRAPCNRFRADVLADSKVQKGLARYVCVQVPLDATITIRESGEKREIKLLEHEVFDEMLGRPGIAIVDYANREAPHYKRVVSTFPITQKLWYTAEKMQVILDLPNGTLTQRTLIYAVRTHPERPRSTEGNLCSYLTQ
ncbi:MAG: hypothetical protein ACOCWL_03285, partial [Thermoguttaceae bacterium]